MSNVPRVVDAATADTALFLMLGALRGFNAPMSSLRVGEWRGEARLGRDPEGKILGVLGMGGIGSEVARRARAVGMTVWYHNRRRVGEGKEGGAEYKGFEELLRGVDVLSVNVPLNVGPHTRPQIGKNA